MLTNAGLQQVKSGEVIFSLFIYAFDYHVLLLFLFKLLHALLRVEFKPLMVLRKFGPKSKVRVPKLFLCCCETKK